MNKEGKGREERITEGKWGGMERKEISGKTLRGQNVHFTRH